MAINKKIWFGDSLGRSILEDYAGPPVNPGPDPEQPRFTFDSMEITFDSIIRTFDEI
jgi:hypothetical protein